MQVAGRPSWRFEESDAGDLDAALFIRDAGRLAPQAAPDVPPPLRVRVVRQPETAPSAMVASQWVTWWRVLIGFRAEEAQPPHRPASGEDMHAWLRAKAQRYAAVFDPPEFRSLASMPELRVVATAMFADWQSQPRREPRIPPGKFAYEVVRAAAEGAAAEFGVSPGEIDGSVHVLEVDRSWSYLAGPGYALCSGRLAADPAAASQLLRAVFASRLGRS